VVIGGSLTGISGLFLSIPFIALLKIICDEIEELKPWGLLLGDETTYSQKTKLYKKLEKISLRPRSKSNVKRNG
jgi:hypothetical protein